jgi:hypothetical protein
VEGQRSPVVVRLGDTLECAYTRCVAEASIRNESRRNAPDSRRLPDGARRGRPAGHWRSEGWRTRPLAAVRAFDGRRYHARTASAGRLARIAPAPMSNSCSRLCGSWSKWTAVSMGRRPGVPRVVGGALRKPGGAGSTENNAQVSVGERLAQDGLLRLEQCRRKCPEGCRAIARRPACVEDRIRAETAMIDGGHAECRRASEKTMDAVLRSRSWRCGAVFEPQRHRRRSRPGWSASPAATRSPCWMSSWSSRLRLQCIPRFRAPWQHLAHRTAKEGLLPVSVAPLRLAVARDH